MVDTPKTADDFANMTDEDFLKLDESDYGGDIPDGETSLTSEELHVENQQQAENKEETEDDPNLDDNQSSSDSDDSDDSWSDPDPNAAENQEEDPEAQGGTGIDPMAEAAAEASDGTEKLGESSTDSKDGEQSESDPEEKGKKAPDEDKPTGKEKPIKAIDFKLPEGMSADQATSAFDFFKKITASFKADGKDFTVRTPEDAIRLMQQGVNYSRRMQEIKPIKAMNRLLSDHGLNDPEKVSFLIDISKGDKAAITKLLKDNNLDPMDLDVSEETSYQTKSYAGNPEDNAFRDALDNLTTTPEGQALVSDIHSSWDDQSKAKLRENPGIMGNLLDLKQAGIYQQVNDELNYQKSMGYLTHTPYLEAFDQVGEAMKNAGVFKSSETPTPQSIQMGQLQNTQQGQPLASGVRKATPPKKASPNPHLSSKAPTKQASVHQDASQNFDKMTDEDFLKMAPPE